MNSPGKTPTGRRRRGFTLMEIMLVLALIVVVFAMTVPAWRGPMENHRLRKSGDTIRIVWAKARIRAMETGRIQCFRFQIDGNRCAFEPWIADDDAIESSGVRAMGFDAQGPGQIPIAVGRSDEEELPEGIFFLADAAVSDRRAWLIQQTMAANEVATGAMDVQLSQPILFYPDGTSSSAQVALGNTRGRRVTISLRGITGVARVGELMRIEEGLP